MSHQLHRRSSIVPTAGLLLAGIAMLSCGHKPATSTDSSPNASGANDDKIVDLMEKMRARALKNPGGTIEAADFAYNVTQLYVQGVTQRRDISPKLVDEAVKCLDDARLSKPDDAPDLLARKGEMLLAADRTKEGVGALRLSIVERPNVRAFKPLVAYYESQKMVPETEALCKRTLPAMTTGQSRYLVIEECLKATGANPDSGVKWADKKEISFYKNRKKELDARQAAAAKAKAKEEAAAEPKK